MDFASIRIVTGDVARLVEFYEKATGVSATWSTEDFAELKDPGATLAIAGTRTVPLFAPGSSRPADNHSVIIGEVRPLTPGAPNRPPLSLSLSGEYGGDPGRGLRSWSAQYVT